MKKETLVVSLLERGEDGRFKVALVSRDKRLNVANELVMSGAAMHSV